MYIPVTPVSKPRMTRSDVWKQRACVVSYRAYKDALRPFFKEGVINELDCHLLFFLPMPASWSAKKRLAMEGKPHQTTPDIDNLVKGFFDAIVKEDSNIYGIHAYKVWMKEGGIYYGKDDVSVLSQAIKGPEARPEAIVSEELARAAVDREVG